MQNKIINKIDLILKIVSIHLKSFLENTENEVKSRKLNFTPYANSIYEIFLENLFKFENIIQVLIESPPEELYKEVKQMILIEFENISFEIRNYLEQNKIEKFSK